jgi:type IV pilus assembly protein PilX
MKMNSNRLKFPGRQDGAALIVGLILMVVITILAISGMNTATTELAMARNDQSYENAFQAAETGLEMALSQGRFNTLVNVNLAQTVNAFDSVTAVINFEETTLVPDRAFSMGVGSGIAAYHFNAVATAESKFDPGGTDRDAFATHTQAFYVVGPEAGSL